MHRSRPLLRTGMHRSRPLLRTGINRSTNMVLKFHSMYSTPSPGGRWGGGGALPKIYHYSLWKKAVMVSISFGDDKSTSGH